MNPPFKSATRIADGAVSVVCLASCLVGVTASKGMSVLLIMAGLAGMLGLASARRHRMRLDRVPMVLLALLLLWGAVSSIWSLDPGGALKLGARLAGICILGYFALNVALEGSEESRIKDQKLLFVGYTLGGITLALGYGYAKVSGMSLWGSFYFDPLTTMNSGAVIVALMLFPVATALWTTGRRAIGLVLLIFVPCAFLLLSSGASLLVIASGAAAFFLVYFFGRPAGLAIAAIAALLFVSAPTLLGAISVSELIGRYGESLAPSAQHRLLMWEFVVHKIQEHSYWGWGLDASRHIPQEAFRLTSNMEIMPLHPHDAALQIRLELGWPGILIAALFVFFVLLSLLKRHADRFHMAARMGAACAYIAVGGVSYGVWQNWWIASGWILAMAMAIAASPAIGDYGASSTRP